MSRRPEIDPHGKPSVIVAVRFASDIIEMLDLLTDNRSELIREYTEKGIAEEMENREKR